ncbi:MULTISPECIES: HlyD family efflux transporter periplasmic adaptor subunit [Paenibacillus]|uniref:HlyD family secretion protein n=1 Tax=Paenibacillus naphthalenovorans TaxID=162209 RepID=A0A0U2W3K0_9BACL|nr:MULTISPECIES: HlyD family efflux transporter periplasmic adaptor subunit [Paenibacillus]ALS22053.1 HlyD family secretion protein [Paenibacillus naphthalenovorans]SDJ57197.1 HlyD family secretion protein [Paenibacillus naphthalenovorans]
MKRKLILILIIIVIIGSGAGIGSYFWYQSVHYVKTEDARLAGEIYRVMPKISGKLNTLTIKQGDTVVADQIVGQQDITNLSSTLLDQASLRSPVSGTVIHTSAKPGEVVTPGQSVAMIVDKKALYVSANIEETEIEKIKLGQYVEFSIDSFPSHTLTGKVYEIGNATASTFSLLPTTSTSGNFTKVTQRIGVKISIDDQRGLNLSPGMSAEVKIHIKGEN